MHILFAIKGLSPPPGGAERVLATISSELAERGHRITVASFDDPGADDFYPMSNGIERVRLGKLNPGNSRATDLLARVRLLRKLSLRPDVAVGFMHSAYVPLAIALIGTGTPLIASERTSYHHYQRHILDNVLIHLCLPLMDRLTVNGEGIRNGFPSLIRRKMVVIQNPVARPVRQADSIRDSKILLSVGGFRPEKDHRTLVEAFARISSDYPDWRLRLVGEGPLRADIERLVRHLGIEDNVSFAGLTRVIEDEYGRAQLFVLPSLYEAFPNGLAEALANGLPAIGFANCPGTNELIEDGVSGLLAAGDDRVTGLAAALATLMGSPEKRLAMGSAAAASVVKYSLKRIADEWENLLDAVVSGGAQN